MKASEVCCPKWVVFHNAFLVGALNKVCVRVCMCMGECVYGHLFCLKVTHEQSCFLGVVISHVSCDILLTCLKVLPEVQSRQHKLSPDLRH